MHSETCQEWHKTTLQCRLKAEKAEENLKKWLAKQKKSSFYDMQSQLYFW